MDQEERFEVFTVVKIQVAVFRDVTPCSEVVGYRHFGGLCCLKDFAISVL